MSSQINIFVFSGKIPRSGIASFPGGSMVKNLPANAGRVGDMGSVLGLGRSPGEGNCNPLLYSCLGNPMDRRVWQLQRSQTQLID